MALLQPYIKIGASIRMPSCWKTEFKKDSTIDLYNFPHENIIATLNFDEEVEIISELDNYMDANQKLRYIEFCKPDNDDLNYSKGILWFSVKRLDEVVGYLAYKDIRAYASRIWTEEDLKRIEKQKIATEKRFAKKGLRVPLSKYEKKNYPKFHESFKHEKY